MFQPYHSEKPIAQSDLSPAQFWISIFLFAGLVLTSFVAFEQQILFWFAELGQINTDNPYTLLAFALILVLILALDVLLPVPSSMVGLAAVALLGPVVGSLVIFSGLTLGCILGYLLGAGYFRLISRVWISPAEKHKASKMKSRLGAAALVLLRGVPVLAETSVLAAGMQAYPVRQFLLLTMLANCGLAVAYGYIGTVLAGQEAFWLIVLSAMVLPGLLMLGSWLWSKKTKRLNPPTTTKVQDLTAQFEISYQFPVIFSEQIFSPANPTLLELLHPQASPATKVLLFADASLLQANPDLTRDIQRYFAFHQQELLLLADPVALVPGEQAKQQVVLDQLYQKLLQHGIDRHSWVLALGGGATLDTVGYACATFHRGIRMARIPTTVLAQNDAGIGVKNGINAFGHKNLLGSFCPPHAVINDFSLLKFLPERDRIAGLAEAIKVAAIKDAEFFCWLEQHQQELRLFEPQASKYAIYRCAQLHLEKITQGGDPFERGNGRPLDYGHWSAHKLENLSHYRVRHGEAVAIGMVLDALYAVQLGWLSQSEALRLIQLIRQLGFSLWQPELAATDPEGMPLIFTGLEEFRQHLGGELSIPLLTHLGGYQNVSEMQLPLMQKALEQLAELGLQPDTQWQWCTL